MSAAAISAVSYRSALKEPEGWDVLHVRFLGVNAATNSEMVLSSLVIARDRAGSLIHSVSWLSPYSRRSPFSCIPEIVHH
jgi:hypothetical protein